MNLSISCSNSYSGNCLVAPLCTYHQWVVGSFKSGLCEKRWHEIAGHIAALFLAIVVYPILIIIAGIGCLVHSVSKPSKKIDTDKLDGSAALSSHPVKKARPPRSAEEVNALISKHFVGSIANRSQFNPQHYLENQAFSQFTHGDSWGNVHSNSRSKALQRIVPELTIDEIMPLELSQFLAASTLFSADQVEGILDRITREKDPLKKHKLYALYGFNPSIANVLLGRLDKAYEAPLDPKLRKEAEKMWESCKKFTKTELGALADNEKLCSVREGPSMTVKKYGELAKKWRTLARSLVDFPECQSEKITEAFIKKINQNLRYDDRRDGAWHYLGTGEYSVCHFRFEDYVGLIGNFNNGKQCYPPGGKEVRCALTKYVDWLNAELDKKEINPIILASQAYQRFVSLHPCSDGNGRTGRFIADVVLARFGLPPIAWKQGDLAIFSFGPSTENPSTALDAAIKGLQHTYELIGRG